MYSRCCRLVNFGLVYVCYVFTNCVLFCNLLFISRSWCELYLFTVKSCETPLLTIKGFINKFTLTGTHNIVALTKWQVVDFNVFSVTSFILCSWMCQSIQSEVAQLGQWGDAVSRLAVCVTSHFVVERKRSTSQQTVLTVCHSVTSQPVRLSWEIYRSTFTAWDTKCHDERLFHTYSRGGQFGGKRFPELPSLSLSVFNTQIIPLYL